MKVLFLARLRELTGRASVSVTVAEPGVDSLRASLAALLPAAAIDALFAENVRLAVNQQLWDGRTSFADGDEIAFLPPVTGG
ncbi:MAG: MoaD/ThiS family protein [Pseudomonadales bacterium]|nr:MoaD/ThiS family protein [Pseudomonadales bacterium]MCP5185735.1 MoaD/ThiS family protein [Pseudomonadales bacterium]